MDELHSSATRWPAGLSLGFREDEDNPRWMKWSEVPTTVSTSPSAARHLGPASCRWGQRSLGSVAGKGSRARDECVELTVAEQCVCRDQGTGTEPDDVAGLGALGGHGLADRICDH